MLRCVGLTDNRFWQRLRGKGATIDGIWLSDEQLRVLAAVFQGAALRSERDLEGQKRYLLYFDEGKKQVIGRKAMLDLRKKRLIETNHKFPSATFLLTEHGTAFAKIITDDSGSNPLSARNFVQ